MELDKIFSLADYKKGTPMCHRFSWPTLFKFWIQSFLISQNNCQTKVSTII